MRFHLASIHVYDTTTYMYENHLTAKLRDLVAEFSSHPAYAQLTLLEELALSRSLAVEAIQIYQNVLENPKASDNSKALATSYVHVALNHVRDMCLAASKVDSLSKQHISAASLTTFVSQIVSTVRELCEEDGICGIRWTRLKLIAADAATARLQG